MLDLGGVGGTGLRNSLKQWQNNRVSVGCLGVIGKGGQNRLGRIGNGCDQREDGTVHRFIEVAANRAVNIRSQTIQRWLQHANLHADGHLFVDGAIVSGRRSNGFGQRNDVCQGGWHLHGQRVLRIETVKVRIERQVGSVG